MIDAPASLALGKIEIRSICTNLLTNFQRDIIRKEIRTHLEGELYESLVNYRNYISVFFIKKLNNNTLIVTARDMTKTERKRYAKK
ncbi:MAG: hypothetical protein GY801_25235 [bacterium]|nr:hypothetical protein [bacterium]